MFEPQISGLGLRGLGLRVGVGVACEGDVGGSLSAHLQVPYQYGVGDRSTLSGKGNQRQLLQLDNLRFTQSWKLSSTCCQGTPQNSPWMHTVRYKPHLPPLISYACLRLLIGDLPYMRTLVVSPRAIRKELEKLQSGSKRSALKLRMFKRSRDNYAEHLAQAYHRD